MADKYGFTFQKRQYRWIHPLIRHLVAPSDSDFVSAPSTLTEFRRLWVSEGESPSRQFTCKLPEEKGSVEWTIDTEEDYKRALQFVSKGEIIQLTVSKPVASSEQYMDTGEKVPPQWFSQYMENFRANMMGEISNMIDQKLSQKHGHPKPCGSGAVHREHLSSTEFKCLKIDKKLQKLQNRTQKMSLDMDDVTPTHHKARGERKLSKMNRKIEKLETIRTKIVAKKEARSAAAAVSEVARQATPSAPVMVMPAAEAMEVVQPLASVENSPPSKYDAIVLSDDEAVLHVSVGSAFTKTWRVKNVGELAWTDKTELRLSHATAGLTTLMDKIPVQILHPGEEWDIAVNFQAPSFPGLFETYWHLYNGEDRFGQWLRCSISVDLIPGEQWFVRSPSSTSTLTLHPAIKEIQEANLSASQIESKKNDRGEYESDDDDDEDDDISSDSDDSDSFVHIPMPPCYQYKMDQVETAAATASLGDNQPISSTSLTPAGPVMLDGSTCKTPPSTPRTADSDDEEVNKVSDTTQIKYPVLDFNDMDFFNPTPLPPIPALVPSGIVHQAEEKESSPVHILPETLVTGAMNVAAKAISGAEAFIRTIHSSTTPGTTFNVVSSPTEGAPRVTPTSTPASSGPPSVMVNPRTQHLITLSDMGFYNHRLNEQLLDQYGDNVENVVADLILREKGH